MSPPAALALFPGKLRAPIVLRSLCRAGLLFAVATLGFAAQPAKRAFDLRAESADKSLKRFSEQAGVEVLFPTKVARSVRTREVKGEMTPKQALDLMLTGTGLVMIEDPKTQAFSIRRETDVEKNGQRAAQSTGSDRPTI